MATEFASVLSAPPSGRHRCLVIDHQRYAQAVILRNRPVPWHDAVAYANFFNQAQDLLKPDFTLFDIGAMYEFLIDSDETLVKAMSARSRTGYALKTLLQDEDAAARVRDVVSVLSQTAAAPLALRVPSPLGWLARTHVLSGAGSVHDLTADHAENSSMYMADWLRRLSELPVSLLLLDTRGEGSEHQLPTVDLAAYTPIANVTDHYRWTLGERTHDGVRIAGSSLTGVAIPQDYWRDESATAPAGDFLIADIPPDAVPETVLAQLARLT
ncbi:hypothetical protein LI90_2067 [Carbonactinospora thermoautotrophica]|uniref:Uncharacterized protein n=1 Tax=Carbonactinospora thermoautotrophica TaxID=1469144 RepID=A0A132MT90_9ACTN|nr:hypothetical protein [Carbonactinospora thermoautotrophica]KWX01039.1 hypothetical protein LI90_2067 [Carbonactinospora thermoautotrophica]